jgi:hypothetical protein
MSIAVSFTFTMRFYLPLPIKVHVWGGLGSQLFALALAEDLAHKFPLRNLRLVFHTGGVTYRKLEIAPLLFGFKFVIKNDFRSPNSTKHLTHQNLEESSIWKKIRLLLKKLVFLLGFFSSLDSNHDFQKCKPWIISVRGHYTHRVISSYSIDRIISRAESSDLCIPKIPSSNGVVGIHYRLGDLLHLSSKNPINSNLIVERALSIQTEAPGVKFLLLSDSTQRAKVILGRLKPLECKSFDPWSTIVALTENEFFIGTNSKISQWAVIFRLYLDHNSNNFIPATFYWEVLKSIPLDIEYSNFHIV